MGGPAVIRRRRRMLAEGKNEADAMDEALIELSRSLGDGESAAVHGSSCQVVRGGRCSCRPDWIGPAVRGVWQ